MRQVQRGREPGREDRRRGRNRPGRIHALDGDTRAQVGLEGQRQIAAAHLDFEHGDQAHVAVLRAWVGRPLVGRHRVGKRRVVARPPLNLALLVTARPVQDVHHISQVLGIDRAKLVIHQHGIIGAGRTRLERKIARLPLERVVAGEGRSLADHAERRKVALVGHAVVVAVEVEQVGRAVAVGVAAGGVHRGRHAVDRAAFGTFEVVGQGVLISVRRVGVAVPALVLIRVAHHFQGVAEVIAVAIRRERAGAQAQHFPTVPQPVAVAVLFGRIGAHQPFLAVGQQVLVRVGGFFCVGTPTVGIVLVAG